MRVRHLKAFHDHRALRYARAVPALSPPLSTLQCGFTVPRLNQTWVTDITYGRTNLGRLVLSGVVMDLYSRRIVDWPIEPTLPQNLVLDALLMSMRRRKPQHVLIHYDQGSQSGSVAWLRFCRTHHLELSMSRSGNCRGNTVGESFLNSLMKEWIPKRICRTREIVTTETDEYIETSYNRTRRHSHLSGVSPYLKQYRTCA